MRARWIHAVLVALLCVTTVTFAEDSAPSWPTADGILERLRRTLDWYQHARLAMQNARDASVILAAREEEQTITRVVQRVFEAARAQATLVEQTRSAGAAPGTASTPGARRAERRAKLEAAIRDGAREVDRLRERASGASGERRAALERERTAAANRLALDRLRLELLTSLQNAEAAIDSGDADLVQQVQALQETVPEVFATAATPPAPARVVAAPVTAGARPAAEPAPASGTWSSINRLLALQRARRTLGQFATITTELGAEVDADAERGRAALRELSRRLRAVATNPAASEALTEDDFRRELEKIKGLGAALVPMRAESALLKRVASDVRAWQRGIDRESRKTMQHILFGLVGLVIGLGAIAVGAFAWRVAVNRYVTDPYRRRLLLRARTIAAAVAVALVLVFHFTSELTALVTALGFAAAGIAFALQNVILSMAGYFSMVAPNGIRVGDRVSLQGPFGYVHGEVIEIGLVRLRLRELTADRLEPTGRLVVFPNSVVFTGSFFKLPSSPARAA
jgi:hypothetical protein